MKPSSAWTSLSNSSGTGARMGCRSDALRAASSRSMRWMGDNARCRPQYARASAAAVHPITASVPCQRMPWASALRASRVCATWMTATSALRGPATLRAIQAMRTGSPW
ncbi:hypothetical protein G6F61_014524 [Rhizopus arrhizus]|nr:hypothetical protein G6F61_014524 [Rhizopus arrhizus]